MQKERVEQSLARVNTLPHHDPNLAISVFDQVSITPPIQASSFRPSSHGILPQAHASTFASAPSTTAVQQTSHPSITLTPGPTTSGAPSASPPVVAPQSNDSSEWDVQLQLQRFQLDLAIHIGTTCQPADLEFVDSPRNVHEALVQPYVFAPAPNPPGPLRLMAHSSLNAPFLRSEVQLLDLLERLEGMGAAILREGRPALIAQRDIIRSQILGSLSNLYNWKRDIWWRQKNSIRPLPQAPSLDTVPYLDNARRAQSIPSFLLPGILMVLILRLIFGVDRKASQVTLASLRCQARILATMPQTGLSNSFVDAIPLSVSTVIKHFDLEPRVKRFVCCPKCLALYPPTDFPETCGAKSAPDLPECGARLVGRAYTNAARKPAPRRFYLHNDLQHWLGRFLCRPEIEEFLDKQKSDYQARAPVAQGDGPVHSILDAKGVHDFVWPDGRLFFDCPIDEYRLSFALATDGFNPYGNKAAGKSVSSTGIYLFCLNLPLSERQKPQNICLLGLIPGPNKPTDTQMHPYLDLVVNDMRVFWETGVRYSRTSRRPTGVLVRAAVIPLFGDALALRQMCGFSAVTSTHFCTFCYLTISDIENFDKSSWPARRLQDHRHWAQQWLISDSTRRSAIYASHGISWTPLFKLPYFDPIKYSTVDTMHNLPLGLFERHIRKIWGMDFTLDDGDGLLKVSGKLPVVPTVAKMTAGRLALSFHGLEFLKECSKPVLFHLCLENNLRRGGKRKDHIRELARWRTGQQISNVDQGMDVLMRQGEVFISLGLDLKSIPLKVLKHICVTWFGPTFDTKSGAKGEYTKYLKEIKLASQDPASICNTSILRQGLIRGPVDAPDRRRATAVLGRDVLAAMIADRSKIILPPWIQPVPALAGTKKNGKLNAYQWQVLCTVHLPITLIRLWGSLPETSRQFKMLTNFLNLVNAVEIASMFVTSREHREAYHALMTSYLVGLKELYPEDPIVSNHHIALHVPDMQETFGPAVETQGVGWERYQRVLQSTNVNNHFGQLEATYMFTVNRTANLMALLDMPSLNVHVKELYDALQDNLTEPSVGSRLHGLRSSKSEPVRRSKRKFQLDDTQLHLLADLLNLPEGGPLYIPYTDGLTSKTERSQIFLHPSAVLCTSVIEQAMEYMPAKRSIGASNIVVPCAIDPSIGVDYRPGRIETIFLHARMTSDNTAVEEVFCIIRYLKPIPTHLISHDTYRKFGALGGSLWASVYEETVEIIRPSAIRCHFGLTALEVQTPEIASGDVYHVLPLDKLRRKLELWRALPESENTRMEDVGEVQEDSDDEAYWDDGEELD